MKVTNNKILIIGGSAGIGFEIAKLFSQDNKVIITGRSERKLQRAAEELRNVSTIVSDVSDAEHVEQLVGNIYAEHPDLNILVNNAGKAFLYNLAAEGVDGFGKAAEEIETNFLSIIRMNEKLLNVTKHCVVIATLFHVAHKFFGARTKSVRILLLPLAKVITYRSFPFLYPNRYGTG